MNVRAWAIVAALLASGCSGPKPEESDGGDRGNLVPLVLRGKIRVSPPPTLLPFTTAVSNGSEIFAWRMEAFVPSAFTVNLTEDTGGHGAMWRPWVRSRVPNDNFMVYV